MPYEYEAARTFKKRFRKKDPVRRKAVTEAIRKLTEDPTRPGLQVKRVQSAVDVVYEASVSRTIRMTFHWEGNKIVLRNNCEHDRVLSSP
ncbi:MAG: cytotoxin [Chloroflexota bacterium]